MKTFRRPRARDSGRLSLGTNDDLRYLYRKHRNRREWMLPIAVAMTLACCTTMHQATLVMSSAQTVSSSSSSQTQPQQQQQQQLMKQTSPAHHQQNQLQLPSNEPHTINLIPVDQPVLTSDQQSNNNKAEQPPQHHQTAASLESTTSAEVAAFESASSFRPEDPTETMSGEPMQTSKASELELEEDGGGLPAELRGERLYETSSAQAEKTGNRQVDSLGSGAYEHHNQQVPINQLQLDYPATTGKQQLHNNQQSVERRFGLFKKHHHYGTPISMSSANYVSAPYMTDCERCLASLGPQSADLQQLEPMPIMPPPQPVPVPVPVPIPQPIHIPQPTPHIQPAQYNPQPSYSPLKNKLFMKFPFFMKGGNGPSGTFGGDQIPSNSYSAPLQLHEAMPAYWHHYQPPTQRPQMSNALYLRPASAYNCIQASAPLVSAASHQEVTLASTKGQVKQYPQQQHQQQQQQQAQQQQQQQQTYSSSQY